MKTTILKMTKMNQATTKTNQKTLFYFLTCALIWGLTWIAIKYQIPYTDGSVAVFYRFVFSSFIMLIVCLATKTHLKYTAATHLRFLSQGLFMFSCNFLLTYWASSMASSALIALTYTTLIFFNMFGAFVFFNTPFEKKVVIGALVSFLGMGLIAFNEYNQRGLHPLSLIGIFISMFGVISASSGNLLSASIRKQQIPILASNGWSMFYGAIVTGLFCLVSQKSFAVNITQEFILSFIYLSVLGTVVSFWSYIKLIEKIGPTKAAFTSVVSPIIALAVSTFFENFHWTAFLVIGSVLCLVGNIMALVPIESLKNSFFVLPKKN